MNIIAALLIVSVHIITMPSSSVVSVVDYSVTARRSKNGRW